MLGVTYDLKMIHNKKNNNINDDDENAANTAFVKGFNAMHGKCYNIPTHRNTPVAP